MWNAYVAIAHDEDRDRLTLYVRMHTVPVKSVARVKRTLASGDPRCAVVCHLIGVGRIDRLIDAVRHVLMTVHRPMRRIADKLDHAM